MYREIEHPDLILLIPLTPEEQRRAEYLDETLTDGQWEVRDFSRDDAIACAGPGGDQVLLGQFIHDAVVHLYDAIDTVSQDMADAFAREATDVEGVTIGPENARAMIDRHMDENQWTSITMLNLIADWIDEDEARVVSLSRYFNDAADTDREASLDA